MQFVGVHKLPVGCRFQSTVLLLLFQVNIQFVENMLTVHKKYKELIQEVFNGDQSFVGALDKACTFVVNHRPNPKMACRSPEMVGMVYGNKFFFYSVVSSIVICLL